MEAVSPSRAREAAPAELRRMIRAQYEAILAHDPGTRLGADPEALHKMRVAVRRLRTVLRVARPLLDREWSTQLRAELGWLGRILGRVRDLDVLLEHLRLQGDGLASDEAGALARIVTGLEAERLTARAELISALTGRRYLALMESVEHAAEAPRVSGASTSLDKLAEKEFRKLERAVDRAGDDPDDEALHRVRVAGKRARYACELARPDGGRKASRFLSHAKDFQDIVGEHQDAVVAERRLREATGALREARSAFVAGRLVERQQERRRAARADVPRAWNRLRRAGRKVWA